MRASPSSPDATREDALATLIEHPPDLPVVAVLDDIRHATGPGASLVLTAPPGTGKSTLVPPALAVALPRTRVLVTQPRRVAVRATARRIASLLHQPVGADVGYSVRGDSRTSPSTRIEMVTPGVLLRRLQADPGLEGVGAVVLDEFHERQLDTDLALALLLDVRQALREDLVLALTSATLEVGRTAELLTAATGAAPHTIGVPARLHPLEVRWAPPPRGAEALGVSPTTGEVVVRRDFLAHVARTVARTLRETSGDVLVFLPGAREIDDVRAMLASAHDASGARLLTLHGSLPPADQDRVLAGGDPGGARRVVLATAIAETSLTVPGVRVVVDACLSREPRTDVARGVPALVTVQAARARCEQRAGRAARLGPGLAVRCIAEADWARRPAQPLPEIATADLTDALLQCSVWGNPGMEGLALLDAPPRASLAAAGGRLRELGAIDEGGRATPLGRSLAELPLDPPLARALLDAAPRIGSGRAARLVALLGEDTRVPGADLQALARTLGHGGGDPGLRHRVTDQERRLSRLLRAGGRPTAGGEGSRSAASAASSGPAHANSRTGGAPGAGSSGRDQLGDEDALALVVALAHPGWTARRRPGTDRYLLADGLGASLPPGSPLAGQEWLAVAEVQRGSGRAEGVLRAAVPITRDDALAAGAALVERHTTAELVGGRLRAQRTTSLGAIAVSRSPLAHVPEDLGRDALDAALRREGPGLFPWSPAALALRHRLAALHEVLGDPWPDVSDEGLLARRGQWLDPALGRIARGAPLSTLDTVAALRSLLPWPQASRLDDLVPERMVIPTGATRALDWSVTPPTLTLRVQEAFGWTDTPRVVDGRLPVVVHLTDPAGRPVAVTSDLASFWSGPYRDVRAQLRGRYPKHPWPEDPLHAAPTSRAKPRRRR